MAVILAIDAGTTGVRTLAFDDGGRLLYTAYRPLTQHFPRPGWVEHHPDEIWTLTHQTLSEAAAFTEQNGLHIAALGITNQRETSLAWSRTTGAPLAPAIVWQDRRTARRCRQLQEEGHTDRIRATTGLVLDPYFSATKFEWLLSEGTVTAPADFDLALGTVDTWLAWQLTGASDGGRLVTDPSNASRTMLFDIHAGAWSEELCDLFSVPRSALADVVPSAGRIGHVSPTAVPGQPALHGVPISAIAGDQQAALFGQACRRTGMAKVTYGTGSFVLAYAGTEPPPPAPGLLTTVAWDLGPHGPGRTEYAVEGSTFVAGAAIGWLRDGLGLIEQSGEVGALAASVPDAGGVLAVPAFAGLGSPWWDPDARGTVLGISRGTTRAHLARAVVEAMAYSVRDMVDAMQQALPAPLKELRADGGAAVMGLLLGLQAEQLGIPVVRPHCTESTALGVALLAGLAEGVWTSPDALDQLWQPDEVHRPAQPRTAVDAAYGRWLTAVERSRGWAPASG